MKIQYRNRIRWMSCLLLSGSLLSACVPFEHTVWSQSDGKPLILHRTEVSMPWIESLPADATQAQLALSLEGAVLRLPVTASRLEQQGWRMDPAFFYESIRPGQYVSGIRWWKEGRVLLVMMGNPLSDRSIRPGDGVVVGIELRSDLPGQAAAVLESTVSLGMDRDEVNHLLGEPDAPRTDSSEESELFSPSVYRKQGIIWRICYNAQDQAARIQAMVSQPTRRAMAAITVLESPVWGEDPTTGRILVEGDFYRLPGKLQDFTKTGWQVSRGLEMLMPNSQTLLSLSRSGRRMTLGVRNDSAEFLPVNECRVISLAPSMGDNGPAVQLTPTLKTGAPHSAAKGLLDYYKPRSKNQDALIWYEVIRKDFEIRVAVDTSQDRVVSIEIKHFRYPWEMDPALTRPQESTP